MKNLAGMAIFAHVVEERSFSAAARRLGMSAKVGVFIDFLVARFSLEPYWDRDWAVTRKAGGARKPRKRAAP